MPDSNAQPAAVINLRLGKTIFVCFMHELCIPFLSFSFLFFVLGSAPPRPLHPLLLAFRFVSFCVFIVVCSLLLCVCVIFSFALFVYFIFFLMRKICLVLSLFLVCLLLACACACSPSFSNFCRFFDCANDLILIFPPRVYACRSGAHRHSNSQTQVFCQAFTPSFFVPFFNGFEQ